MALGVAVVKRIRYPWSMGGGFGIKDVLIEVTGEASYVTGGSAITAAQLNVNRIIAVLPNDPYPLVGRSYLWNRTTGMLQAQVPAGTEVTSTTNCSADKVVCYVVAA